ncbi:RraA family protein [Gracilibacillus salitolerans]|uniref:Putative 4-hydroxy-4-methyl-2-oxoglutarate aldolase n=1 Tax=Gracilibacillus salitolerans TaxID=2663022 RepID=A0A5Q2TMD7_9BACI|nr:RraA family protein [Gracilibacillus salitolerans]QGH36114.1 RraA family protein [Gracilibacillus salitolerans]
MENLGFRILKRESKVSPTVIKKFENVVTPHVSDNMNRMFAGGPVLKPFYKSGKLLGAALTVKTRPGDNLMVHKAIDIAEPGDVLVVDAGGDTTNAIVGEIMLELSKKKEIKGFVINGAIRDSAAFLNGDFPVYAKGVTHRGPYKDGPGEINVPVSIDGMVIHSGDLILGDEDGVVSIPQALTEDVLEQVKIQEKKELETFQAIENDRVDRTWVDAALKNKGCEWR